MVIKADLIITEVDLTIMEEVLIMQVEGTVDHMDLMVGEVIMDTKVQLRIIDHYRNHHSRDTIQTIIDKITIIIITGATVMRIIQEITAI